MSERERAVYNSGDGSSRTPKTSLVVVSWGRLIFLRFSFSKICCFVSIEFVRRRVSFTCMPASNMIYCRRKSNKTRNKKTKESGTY